MLLKSKDLDNMIIASKGATISGCKVEVMEIKDGDSMIYIFKCNGKHGTTATEVLPKSITKENIVASLDAFGDRGAELLGKGMGKLGKLMMGWGEKLNK